MVLEEIRTDILTWFVALWKNDDRPYWPSSHCTVLEWAPSWGGNWNWLFVDVSDSVDKSTLVFSKAVASMVDVGFYRILASQNLSRRSYLVDGLSVKLYRPFCLSHYFFVLNFVVAVSKTIQWTADLIVERAAGYWWPCPRLAYFCRAPTSLCEAF